MGFNRWQRAVARWRSLRRCARDAVGEFQRLDYRRQEHRAFISFESLSALQERRPCLHDFTSDAHDLSAEYGTDDFLSAKALYYLHGGRSGQLYPLASLSFSRHFSTGLFGNF